MTFIFVVLLKLIYRNYLEEEQQTNVKLSNTNAIFSNY